MIRRLSSATLALAAALVAWPLFASPGAKVGATPLAADVADTPACPDGMLLVDGEWFEYVEQYCKDYIAVERDRCGDFHETGRAYGSPAHLRFCIDRYEWPNQRGALPEVTASWDDATAKCHAAGKRLCENHEWTLACEGNEHLPHPYGYARNADACNIDKPYIVPDNEALHSHDAAIRARELRRLDQREPSGSREACVSPFGVSDMTGNVDEWVWNAHGKLNEKPYDSGLKGGYWGPVRNRCRPMTTDHNRWHWGYQIGFRCCANAK